MTILDNVKGMSAMVAQTGEADYQLHTMQYDDNVIIGESEAPDCPQNETGGYCFKKDKTGIILGAGLYGGKA